MTGRIAGMMAVFLLAGASGGGTSDSNPISLCAERFEAIAFRSIPPTTYTFEDNVLICQVDCSASILLQPFDEVTAVSAVSFEWKSQGEFQVKDAEHETSKAGDDALLRVGLVLHGEPPRIPVFAPSWVRQIRDILTLPSGRMILLKAGSRHPPESTWPNPDTGYIKYVSVASEPMEDSWKKATYTFEEELEAAGLWLMADGDRTDSRFTTKVRNIRLE